MLGFVLVSVLSAATVKCEVKRVAGQALVVHGCSAPIDSTTKTVTVVRTPEPPKPR